MINTDSFRCKGVVKAFDGVHALAGIDLIFPPSGITAVIGPNGAGKTTLVNVLTGFLRPSLGCCFLGENETTHLPPSRIARLGVARTFQDLRLIEHMPVQENVMLARPNQRGERFFPALLHLGVAKEEAHNRKAVSSLLEFVGLDEAATVLAGELSYGQQKLLTLACCLATEARILFLDEPVAGVAPEMVSRILALLSQLRDQGKLIIFIEHDIEAVRQIADHVIVMDNGKIIADGTPGCVLERPEIMEAYLV